jgi:hypothetical protein
VWVESVRKMAPRVTKFGMQIECAGVAIDADSQSWYAWLIDQRCNLQNIRCTYLIERKNNPISVSAFLAGRPILAGIARPHSKNDRLYRCMRRPVAMRELERRFIELSYLPDGSYLGLRCR